jgi:hypothetical protein
MGRRRKSLIPGVSFSWRRATGLSAAKGRLSRKTGFPLTRAGRQRKMGRMMGCALALLVLAAACLGPVLLIWLL